MGGGGGYAGGEGAIVYLLQQRLVESERARERAQLTLQALQQGATSVMEEAQVSGFR